MADVTSRVAPGSDGHALAVDTGLGAPGGVLVESLRTIGRVEGKLVVLVADVASGGVDRLEGEAASVSETSVDLPLSVAGRGGNFLGVDGLTIVSDNTGGAASRGGGEGDGVSSSEGVANVQVSLSILGGNNVGLDLGLSVVIGEAREHGTLVEGTLRSATVVTTNTENNSTLLSHGVVVTVRWAGTRVNSGKIATVGIATLESPAVARVALELTSDKVGVDGRVAAEAPALGATGEQVVLEISHDPRTVALTSAAPAITCSKVESLHSSVTDTISRRILVVGLSVTIVEAASTVVVSTVEDSVHALGIIVGGNASGLIVTVAGHGRTEHTVGLLAVQGDRSSVSTGQEIHTTGFRAITSATTGSTAQVVVVAGLIVDDGDAASLAIAEGILSIGVSGAASGHGTNILSGTITTEELVERSIVGTVQSTSEAVSSNTRGATSFVDIARTLDAISGGQGTGGGNEGLGGNQGGGQPQS